MNRFRQALGVSSVITLYVMCFYYAFATFDALLHGTSVVQAFINTLIAGMVLFIAAAYGVHQLYIHTDERDAREHAERDEREQRERLEREQREGAPQLPNAPPGDDRR